MCLKILQATQGMSTCSHVDRERWQREAALIHGGAEIGGGGSAMHGPL